MYQECNSNLKNHIGFFIPAINKYHIHIEQKWMRGEISKAAYEQIHHRCVIAKALNNKLNYLQDESLISVCTEITIDLHESIDYLESKEEDTTIYKERLELWYETFRNIGYIDIHPVFRKPEKNLTAFEEFQKKSKK